MEFNNQREYNLSEKPAKVKINSNQNLNLQDAELLAHMATAVTHTRATNGRHYWYYVFEDIKECDFITYLFNRNGLYPKLHYSHYLDEYKFNPVLRMRSKYVNRNSNVKDFVSLIKASRTILHHGGEYVSNYMQQALRDFSKNAR